MDEHSFIRAVHRKLSRSIHRWKIAAKFANGVPDAWYSGPAGDLWVEYKFLRRIPKRWFTVALSALQREWLNARYAEGRNVAVIVGSDIGGLILRDRSWNSKNKAPFQWLTIGELAKWIEMQTLSTSTREGATNKPNG